MTKHHLLHTACLTGLLTAAIAAPVFAQDAPADAPVNDNNEVIVTATRRSERTLAVPYNISALSGDAIANAKVADNAELLRSVPGVSLIDRGYRNSGVFNSIVIRGLNADSSAMGDYAVASVTPVSTYVNDTPLFANFLLRDLDRVEILRGPQGTLYGSGSLGGTIRYITKAPKLNHFEGKVGAGLSSTEGSEGLGYSADGMLNLPFGDKAALRVNLSRVDLPGTVDYVNLYKLDGNGYPVAPGGVLSNAATYYSQEDADTVDIWYGRAALRLAPRDGVDITLSYAQQSDKIGGRRQVTQGKDGYGKTYGDYENGSIQLEPSSRDVSLTALEASVDLGFATLTSSTSYSDHTGDSVSENTGRYASAGWLDFYYNYPRPMASAVRGYSDKALTEELRLVSQPGVHVDYVVGLFYQRETLRATQESYLRGFKRWWDLAFPGSEDVVVSDQDFAYDNRGTYTNTAIFGELTWHVSETFQLTGGLRYFDNKSVNKILVDVPVWAFLSQPANPTFSSGENRPLFKLNASWKLSPKSLAYATVSQGYRRGGTSAVPLTGHFAEDPRWQVYKSDFVTNYEAGLKGNLNGLRFDTALYFVQWDDIQLNTATPNWGFYVVVNGQRAESYGLETQLSGKLGQHLNYTLGYTYTHARLAEDFISPLGGTVAKKGAKLPGTPDHAFTLSGNYTRTLDNGLTSVTRLSGSYQSATRNAINTSPVYNVEEKAFSLWNLSTSLEKNGVSVTAYVKNVFNDPGITGEMTEAYMGTAPADGYYGNGAKKFISQPRTLGLTIDYEF